ncbi:transposase [Cardinium endosymbiont of Oedothorax gibbosus]|uniref:transposase n=1 Tax=Cardinium endosymbiont of Oedothorax gibbosus TaxID=931101 RepID=UPI00202536B0|nr:transposase [Cardinium endosymbiont of Oedothorax gibbosus]
MKRKETVKDGISKAIDVLIESGVDLSRLFDQDGLLKQLSKRLVEKALQSEMDDHLGYNKYARSDSENVRNGLSSKQVITDNGVISVEVPRDRASIFEPILLPKRQTRIPGLDDKILSLYAKGMSLSDIQIQIQELYGAEVSESLISNITDSEVVAIEF